jgi:hypothetical protein
LPGQHAHRDGREARERLTAYFDFLQSQGVHPSLDYHTPEEIYFGAS